MADTRHMKRDLLAEAFGDGLSLDEAIARVGCTRRYAQKLLDDPEFKQHLAVLSPTPEARLYRECESALRSKDIKPADKVKLIATMEKLQDKMDRKGTSEAAPEELIAFLAANGL